MESAKENDGRAHKTKKGVKMPKKVRAPKPLPGMSTSEFERRLMQRERSLAQRYKQASAPGVQRVMLTANPTLRGVRALLEALVDPLNAEPYRLPGGRATFINRLKQIKSFITVPAAAYNAGVTELTPNSGFAVKRRDLRCSLIMSEYNGSANTVYTLIGTDGNTFCPNDRRGYKAFSIAQHTFGFAKHGENFVPWIFADGSSRMFLVSEVLNPAVIAVAALTPLTNYTLKVEFLLGNDYQTLTAAVASDAAGIASFTLPAQNIMGYAAFQLLLTAGLAPQTVGSFTVSDRALFCVRHLAAPGFWQNITDVDAVRVNAASLMYSDRTASSWSQGDICSYQGSGGEPWERCLGNPVPNTFNGVDPYGYVPSFNKGYKGAYKKGKFIPLKLTDDPREQQYVNLMDAQAPWELPPIVYTDQLDFLFIGFNFGASGATASIPMGEWTSVDGMEGESESQWRQVKNPKTHPDVLKEARYVFSQVECDFENVSHVKAIWDWISANMPHLLETGARAIGNAGPYGAAAAGALGTAAEVIRYFGGKQAK